MYNELFTSKLPFGPASLDEQTSRKVAAALFDDGNELDSVFRKSSPVFLVGRRGSGKTAYLKRSIASGELLVDLNTPELVAKVGQTIDDIGITSTGEFTERIVGIWDACFIAAMCSKVWSSYCAINEVDCPSAFEFGRSERKTRQGRATDVATDFLFRLRSRSADLGDYPSVVALADETERNGVPLWKARAELEAAALRRRCNALISMDSLDHYEGMFYEGGALASSSALALRGLFRAASRLGRATDTFYRARISFPAELWHYYSRLSSNPLKDFDNTMLLHWDNRELLHVAATRLTRYIEASQPREFRALPASASGGKWAQELLLRYLPPSLTNAVGRHEFVVSYLLRHTQLLPRHFLVLLNELFAERTLSPGCISPQDVRDAVATAEVGIANTVVDSFLLPYPRLQAVCEDLIPQLDLTFTQAELQKTANQTSKQGMEYFEILKMLVEVGAVGRVIEETTFYARADFEYLHEGAMLITTDERLCLHPAFAGRFDSRGTHANTGSESLPVLPLGSDPTVPREFHRTLHLTRRDDDVND